MLASSSIQPRLISSFLGDCRFLPRSYTHSISSRVFLSNPGVAAAPLHNVNMGQMHDQPNQQLQLLQPQILSRHDVMHLRSSLRMIETFMMVYGTVTTRLLVPSSKVGCLLGHGRPFITNMSRRTCSEPTKDEASRAEL